MHVVRHELLVVPETDGHSALEKVDELDGVRPVGEVEIEALVFVLDAASR